MCFRTCVISCCDADVGPTSHQKKKDTILGLLLKDGGGVLDTYEGVSIFGRRETSSALENVYYP